MEKSKIIKEVKLVLNASKNRELYGADGRKEAEIQLRALELLTDLTYPLL